MAICVSRNFPVLLARPLVAAGLLISLFTACNEEEPGLVHEAQLNLWYYVTEEHGLSSNHINTIFEDSKGNFWFGTNMGLSFLSDHRITNFTRADGLLDNNVFAISEDRNGNIWVGTARGVNILADDSWHYFTFFYQAPVFDIMPLADEKGMLVATGGYGAYRFDYSTEKFSVFNFIKDCVSCKALIFKFLHRLPRGLERKQLPDQSEPRDGSSAFVCPEASVSRPWFHSFRLHRRIW